MKKEGDGKKVEKLQNRGTKKSHAKNEMSAEDVTE